MNGTTVRPVALPVYDWRKVTGLVVRAANLSPAEETSLQNSLVAKILTETAYLSGCHNPERIVLMHLTTLIAAVRCKDLSKHKAGEKVFDRIVPFLNFPGGNEEVVKACSILLQLLSLNDHAHDFGADILNDKYNPLVAINYEEEKKRLIEQFAGLDNGIQKVFQMRLKEVIKSALWWI